MVIKMVVPILYKERHGIQQFNDVLWVMSMCCGEKLELLHRTREGKCMCGMTYPLVARDDGLGLGTFVGVDADNGENITRWAAAWLGAPVMVSLA